MWLSGIFVPVLVAFSLMLPTLAGAAKPQASKAAAQVSSKAKVAPVRLGVKQATNAKKGRAPARASKADAQRVAKAAGPRAKTRVVIRNGKRVVIRHPIVRVRIEPARPSVGQLKGLHNIADALDLKSSVALVLDQDTDEVLFSKNAQAVLPIASLTKLMTAVVVAEAELPMTEMLSVSQADVDTEKGSRSRLRVGTQLSRQELLHLALMSSENRAAHALGREYPGGVDAFVKAMNLKAIALGMKSTRFVEPTGLSSENRSSARDLATLVKAAHVHPVIREMSTSPSYEIDTGDRHLRFVNTNRLLGNSEWDIGLQKTGYISEAGRCLVMQATLAGRHVIMIFLDSAGKYSRLGDAERVRRWIEESAPAVPEPEAAEAPKITS
jgi:serine-type D-Ala-D-Ala endopeptidase (penicillin-binding protein 7)